MHCRVSTPKAIEFRSKLGFKQHDIIMTKEQSILTKIMKVFAKEKILLQHSTLNYRIDLYFPKHRLAREVDENEHRNINENKEKKEKKNIKNLGCKFIRINPDQKYFDIFIHIGKIYNHISE